MAAPPITFLEKKWASGYSNNNLVQAATQAIDRKNVPMLDKDVHRNISSFGRRTLMSIGMWLYANCPIVQGAVDEIATNSALTFIPQYYGKNAAWGEEAEAFLYEHDKICDIAGWGNTMATYRRNLVIGSVVFGDIFTLLTQNADGYPFLQTVPGHRVGSSPGQTHVEGGPYDGARIIDGAILSDSGRTIAWRVLGENTYDYSVYRDISADNIYPTFLPLFPGQIRGISLLGSSAFNWQDVNESRTFEMIAQKLFASQNFTVYNEAGEVDETKKLLKSKATFNSDGSKATVATEKVDGVTINYFKAGTQQRIEAVENNRPSMPQQNFEDRVIRAAMKGMGWDVDFSLEPGKVGGAPMRVVIGKVNSKIAQIQVFVVEPSVHRFDGYRISKVMDNPERPDRNQAVILLPFDEEWYKWRYQGPAKLTADAKYDSDVTIQEIRAGIKTPQRACEERNAYWEEVQDAAIAWEKRLQEKCKDAGVDPNRIVLLTPNGNPPGESTDSRLKKEADEDKQAGRSA